MTRAYLLLMCIAACSKEPATSSTVTPPATVRSDAATPGAPVAPVVTAAAPTPADAHPPLPTDLPPFGKLAGADTKKAMELAHKAIRGTMDADNPLADAVAAVKADPGLPYARYAVACTANDEAFATKQLEAMLAANCDDCADMVRNLIIDSDCPWTDAHRALATKANPSPQRQAVETIAKALKGPDRSAAKPFFTGASSSSRFACSNCSDTSHDRRNTGTGAKVLADVTKVLEKNDKDQISLVAFERMLRDKDCWIADRLQLQHEHVFLDKICFAPGTTTVKSIDLIDG